MVTFGDNLRIQCTYFSSIRTHLVLRIVPRAAIGAFQAWIASALVWLAWLSSSSLALALAVQARIAFERTSTLGDWWRQRRRQHPTAVHWDSVRVEASASDVIVSIHLVNRNSRHGHTCESMHSERFTLQGCMMESSWGCKGCWSYRTEHRQLSSWPEPQWSRPAEHNPRVPGQKISISQG